jgi:hypothetical protein
MKEKGGCKIGLKAPEGSPLGGCKEGLKAKKRIKFKVVDEPKVEPKKKLYVNDPGKAKKKSQQPAQQAKVIAPKPRVAKVAKVIKAKPVKSNTEIVMEARRKVGLGSPGKFEEVSMGYFESATPMNAKFNPVTGNIKTKDNYRMKKLGEWKGEKTFQLERKGNYFVGHGFTVGLLGKGAKDGQGHNIVPALKSKGEKYYAHYSEIGKIDPYIRKFLAPLPKTTSEAKVIAAVKEAQKDTTPLSTPPILPVNVKNAKKIVAFMEKVETDSDKRRLDGRSPTMGHSFYEFKELDGGNLKFTRNGYNKEIEIKKIMKMLKQVKKGEVSYETFLLPKYYKNYLRIIDFNPNVSSKQLF